MKQRNLTPRQHRLKDYLNEHFVSGHYFSIEEIVKNVVDKDGQPYYKLNTDPKLHDKCIALSHDVKRINFNITSRYIPIIKNKWGGIKLAENKEELTAYIEGLKKKVEKQCEYYNTLIYKASLDGVIPYINLAGRVLDDDEIKPIEAYKH